MVNVRLMVHDSAEVELTLEVTMKKLEWMKLREQIQAGNYRSWPCHHLLGYIDVLVQKAEAHFTGDFDEERSL